MVNLTHLADYGNRTLEIVSYQDYCPNGLQVAGRDEIHTLVTGVTASQRFLEAAINAGADAVLVHHGYFWKGEESALVGMKFRRIQQLIKNDVALLAYHLPLDCHSEFGNNAQLGKRFGLNKIGQHNAGGVDGLLWEGELSAPESAKQFIARVSRALDRDCLAVGRQDHDIRRVAWCSGGGQRFLNDAVELGVDAYISGEISEQTTHEAQEQGVLYIAAGHHATERYAVQAFGEHLAEHFGIVHQHIDIDNPA